VLAINVGSSSIKFAVYSAAPQLTSLLQGQLDRVGLDGTTLSWTAGPDRPSGAWTLRTARSRQDC
jgi:acetate kinase